MRNRIFTKFQSTSYKTLTNYKDFLKSNFTVERPGRHHLNQMVKMDITRMGQIKTVCHLIGCNETKHSFTCVAFVPKIHNLNLIRRKPQI